jgi:hypothetical protein
MNYSNEARAYSPETNTLEIDAHAETQRSATIPAPGPEAPNDEDAVPDTERTPRQLAPMPSE